MNAPLRPARLRARAGRLPLVALLAIGLSFAALAAVADEASARPGGGESFSGGGAKGGGGGSTYKGSGGSGSSGGGGGGSTIPSSGDTGDALSYLIGGAAAVVFLAGSGLYAFVRKQVAARRDWNRAMRSLNAPPQGSTPKKKQVRAPTRKRLEALRAEDAWFSLPLFEDFVHALYVELHTARGRGDLERLRAYLAHPERLASAHRSQPTLREVKAILVGGMKIADVERREGMDRVRVAFDANYTETVEGGFEETYFVHESWVFSRKVGARSREPGKTRVFACPSCGAPLERVRGTTCEHCHADVGGGAFDWVVTEVRVKTRERRAPAFTTTVAEVGTNQPTLVDADLDRWLQTLAQKDASFRPDAFEARVRHVFDVMQSAWSERAWMRARPFLTDRLFQVQLAWLEAQRAAGLHNVTERARVQKVVLVRGASDAFYDSLTVRLYATGLDYTLSDESGAVVAGSRTDERRYSEYWTFIRGAKVRGAPRVDPTCPSCGAELKIGETGACEYCNAKVANGEFDWVLSRIEQDEAYQG